MSAFTNEIILGKLTQQFGDQLLRSEEPYGLLTIYVKPESAYGIIAWLREENEMQFHFLTDLCGLHYPDQQGQEIGVVYLLHSLVNNVRLRIKCFIPESDPRIPSLVPVYPTANWLERETFDFYGILFTGHPNLTRIMNVEEMDYFPLRKQYPLEDQTRSDKVDKFFGR